MQVTEDTITQCATNELRFPGTEIDVEALYRKFAPMVLRRCKAMLGNEEEAQDAMQDVFLRLVRSRDRLHGRYPSSLLYRIATNTCLNVQRSARRRRAVADSDLLEGMAASEAVEERILDRAVIDRALRDESPSTLRIVEMHYGESRSLQETAEAVGLSVSGVRKRLSKVHARSQALLCA